MNKKALDQYVSFSEQRDTLQRRKEDLDRSKKVHAPHAVLQHVMQPLAVIAQAGPVHDHARG